MVDKVSIRNFEFYNSYADVCDALLLADLDDIVQLLANKSNDSWVRDRSKERIQFCKIMNEIEHRLKKEDSK